MNPTAGRVLYWTPRGLCILFALFLSLFALDVFGEGLGFWKTVLALLIHLTPVYLVAIVLAVAWRREWVGAILFFGLALCYPALMRRGPWDWYLVISGPLVLLGVLFLLNWTYRDRLRAPSPDTGDQP